MLLDPFTVDFTSKIVTAVAKGRIIGNTRILLTPVPPF
jgi:hypothetical protein